MSWIKSVSDSEDWVAFEICDIFFILNLIFSCFFVINQFWTTEKLFLDDSQIISRFLNVLSLLNYHSLFIRNLIIKSINATKGTNYENIFMNL